MQVRSVLYSGSNLQSMATSLMSLRAEMSWLLSASGWPVCQHLSGNPQGQPYPNTLCCNAKIMPSSSSSGTEYLLWVSVIEVELIWTMSYWGSCLSYITSPSTFCTCIFFEGVHSPISQFWCFTVQNEVSLWVVRRYELISHDFFLTEFKLFFCELLSI